MSISRITFQANFSCFIGSHAVIMGEEVSILGDVNGLYWLYCADDEEPIAHLNSTDVCKLAGRNVFEPVLPITRFPNYLPKKE